MARSVSLHPKYRNYWLTFCAATSHYIPSLEVVSVSPGKEQLTPLTALLIRSTLKTSLCFLFFNPHIFPRLFWLFFDISSLVLVSTHGYKPNTERAVVWRFRRSSQWADSLSDNERRHAEPNNRKPTSISHINCFCFEEILELLGARLTARAPPHATLPQTPSS